VRRRGAARAWAWRSKQARWEGEGEKAERSRGQKARSWWSEGEAAVLCVCGECWAGLVLAGWIGSGSGAAGDGCLPLTQGNRRALPTQLSGTVRQQRATTGQRGLDSAVGRLRGLRYLVGDNFDY
jgi:hypothetical protein